MGIILTMIESVKSDIDFCKNSPYTSTTFKIETLEDSISVINGAREMIALRKAIIEGYMSDDADDADDAVEEILKEALDAKAYAEHLAVRAETKALDAETKALNKREINEYFEEYEPYLPECDLLEVELYNMLYELTGGRKGRKKGREVTSSNFSESAIKQAGEEGEQKVEYALKWLKPSGYKTISRDCHSKYSNSCILLRNASFIDEIQEFDHIVIGQAGIFLIETKNYAGTIYVTNYGDWIQTKNGERKGIKNPVQQCDRHSALMKSIVGNVPIISIICIANDGVIIENRENCVLPIVNVSMLQRFIENAETRSPLTEYQINEIVRKIEQYKVHSYGI